MPKRRAASVGSWGWSRQRGEQAGENDDFGVGGHFDPGFGGTVGIAERVLAQHVEPTVPAVSKALAAALAGELPGQAVAGDDVGQRGGGIGAPADDPVVPGLRTGELGQVPRLAPTLRPAVHHPSRTVGPTHEVIRRMGQSRSFQRRPEQLRRKPPDTRIEVHRNRVITL